MGAAIRGLTMPTTLPDIRYTNLIEELGPLPTKPWRVTCVEDGDPTAFYYADPLSECNAVNGERILVGVEVTLLWPPENRDSMFAKYPYNATVHLALRQYQAERFWTDAFTPKDSINEFFMRMVSFHGASCPIFQCNSVSSRGALRYAARALRLIDKNLEDFLEVPCNNMGSNGSDFLKGELISRPANANHLNKPW